MTLKAVLFDFNGVIIKDEAIHRDLIDEILISENLRSKPGEYRQFCLGRSDRFCLKQILTNRGREVRDGYLTQLVNRKTQAYQQALDKLEELPIYPGLEDFIQKLRLHEVKLAIVSDALRAEVELVLNRTGLLEHFSVIIAADDTTTSKPEPDGYLLAIERLNLKASNCLAIEDTPTGIQAARSAGVQVVGVAHTYPFHMLQRWTNWAVDYFTDLEVERVQQVFSRTTPQATAG
ncbi:HAD family phosphatase [Funiculus sociatus GB2-A5]|uniref:HAD family phosphatase n=1 Tax=Funiculus sociatus GB2-A5 TaxID=2933946 RepID=A0ABV0JS76_9CYAN|nr:MULTISPECIES: HAD family phosphatase [unclassified Trichocoleus]MBD1904983.1 HAD family phosphatase [Trichocoleus sp. FACHB-832]MBD2064053.1 HAD family phosphatase [Trichocoleus sp. FACHB-6]